MLTAHKETRMKEQSPFVNIRIDRRIIEAIAKYRKSHAFYGQISFKKTVNALLESALKQRDAMEDK